MPYSKAKITEKIKARKMTKEKTGKQAENLAVNFLEKQDFEIISRNYRKRFGEIDIIARTGGSLVFVEVKSQKAPTIGEPEAAVTLRKQKRLILAAESYLQEFQPEFSEIRFDVISIIFFPHKDSEINHYLNAFEVQD